MNRGEVSKEEYTARVLMGQEICSLCFGKGYYITEIPEKGGGERTVRNTCNFCSGEGWVKGRTIVFQNVYKYLKTFFS